MIIAVFLTYNYSFYLWNSSGVLDRELKIYKYLSDNFGYKFKFFTYGNNDDINFINNKFEYEIIPLYSKIKFTNNRYLKFFKSFLIPLLIKKDLKHVDIIHQHQIQGSWVTLICKLIYRKKLLIRTGYDVLDFAKKNNKSLFNILFYKILTFICIISGDIYTVSSIFEFNKKLNSYPKKFNEKIKLRSNWIDKNYFTPLNTRPKNKILAVGRIEQQKNIKFLINLIKNLDVKLSLDIIGTGSQLENLKEYSKKNKLDINFLGSFDNQKLLKIYNNYRFFVSTALFEGNPKTILEAMSSGCIVIASNIDGHRELIKDGYTGYMFNLNSIEFSNIFNKILKDDNNLEIISKNAINFVLKNFYINKLAKKWMLTTNF